LRHDIVFVAKGFSVRFLLHSSATIFIYTPRAIAGTNFTPSDLISEDRAVSKPGQGNPARVSHPRTVSRRRGEQVHESVTDSVGEQTFPADLATQQPRRDSGVFPTFLPKNVLEGDLTLYPVSSPVQSDFNFRAHPSLALLPFGMLLYFERGCENDATKPECGFYKPEVFSSRDGQVETSANKRIVGLCNSFSDEEYFQLVTSKDPDVRELPVILCPGALSVLRGPEFLDYTPFSSTLQQLYTRNITTSDFYGADPRAVGKQAHMDERDGPQQVKMHDVAVDILGNPILPSEAPTHVYLPILHTPSPICGKAGSATIFGHIPYGFHMGDIINKSVGAGEISGRVLVRLVKAALGLNGPSQGVTNPHLIPPFVFHLTIATDPASKVVLEYNCLQFDLVVSERHRYRRKFAANCLLVQDYAVYLFEALEKPLGVDIKELVKGRKNRLEETQQTEKAALQHLTTDASPCIPQAPSIQSPAIAAVSADIGGPTAGLEAPVSNVVSHSLNGEQSCTVSESTSFSEDDHLIEALADRLGASKLGFRSPQVTAAPLPEGLAPNEPGVGLRRCCSEERLLFNKGPRLRGSASPTASSSNFSLISVKPPLFTPQTDFPTRSSGPFPPTLDDLPPEPEISVFTSTPILEVVEGAPGLSGTANAAGPSAGSGLSSRKGTAVPGLSDEDVLCLVEYIVCSTVLALLDLLASADSMTVSRIRSTVPLADSLSLLDSFPRLLEILDLQEGMGWQRVGKHHRASLRRNRLFRQQADCPATQREAKPYGAGRSIRACQARIPNNALLRLRLDGCGMFQLSTNGRSFFQLLEEVLRRDPASLAVKRRLRAYRSGQWESLAESGGQAIGASPDAKLAESFIFIHRIPAVVMRILLAGPVSCSMPLWEVEDKGRAGLTVRGLALHMDFILPKTATIVPPFAGIPVSERASGAGGPEFRSFQSRRQYYYTAQPYRRIVMEKIGDGVVGVRRRDAGGLNQFHFRIEARVQEAEYNVTNCRLNEGIASYLEQLAPLPFSGGIRGGLGIDAARRTPSDQADSLPGLPMVDSGVARSLLRLAVSVISLPLLFSEFGPSPANFFLPIDGQFWDVLRLSVHGELLISISTFDLRLGFATAEDPRQSNEPLYFCTLRLGGPGIDTSGEGSKVPEGKQTEESVRPHPPSSTQAGTAGVFDSSRTNPLTLHCGPGNICLSIPQIHVSVVAAQLEEPAAQSERHLIPAKLSDHPGLPLSVPTPAAIAPILDFVASGTTLAIDYYDHVHPGGQKVYAVDHWLLASAAHQINSLRDFRDRNASGFQVDYATWMRPAIADGVILETRVDLPQAEMAVDQENGGCLLALFLFGLQAFLSAAASFNSVLSTVLRTLPKRPALAFSKFYPSPQSRLRNPYSGSYLYLLDVFSSVSASGGIHSLNLRPLRQTSPSTQLVLDSLGFQLHHLRSSGTNAVITCDSLSLLREDVQNFALAGTQLKYTRWPAEVSEPRICLEGEPSEGSDVSDSSDADRGPSESQLARSPAFLFSRESRDESTGTSAISGWSFFSGSTSLPQIPSAATAQSSSKKAFQTHRSSEGHTPGQSTVLQNPFSPVSASTVKPRPDLKEMQQSFELTVRSVHAAIDIFAIEHRISGIYKLLSSILPGLNGDALLSTLRDFYEKSGRPDDGKNRRGVGPTRQEEKVGQAKWGPSGLFAHARIAKHVRAMTKAQSRVLADPGGPQLMTQPTSLIRIISVDLGLRYTQDIAYHLVSDDFLQIGRLCYISGVFELRPGGLRLPRPLLDFRATYSLSLPTLSLFLERCVVSISPQEFRHLFSFVHSIVLTFGRLRRTYCSTPLTLTQILRNYHLGILRNAQRRSRDPHLRAYLRLASQALAGVDPVFAEACDVLGGLGRGEHQHGASFASLLASTFGSILGLSGDGRAFARRHLSRPSTTTTTTSASTSDSTPPSFQHIPSRSAPPGRPQGEHLLHGEQSAPLLSPAPVSAETSSLIETDILLFWVLCCVERRRKECALPHAPLTLHIACSGPSLIVSLPVAEPLECYLSQKLCRSVVANIVQFSAECVIRSQEANVKLLFSITAHDFIVLNLVSNEAVCLQATTRQTSASQTIHSALEGHLVAAAPAAGPIVDIGEQNGMDPVTVSTAKSVERQQITVAEIQAALERLLPVEFETIVEKAEANLFLKAGASADIDLTRKSAMIEDFTWLLGSIRLRFDQALVLHLLSYLPQVLTKLMKVKVKGLGLSGEMDDSSSHTIPSALLAKRQSTEVPTAATVAISALDALNAAARLDSLGPPQSQRAGLPTLAPRPESGEGYRTGTGSNSGARSTRLPTTLGPSNAELLSGDLIEGVNSYYAATYRNIVRLERWSVYVRRVSVSQFTAKLYYSHNTRWFTRLGELTDLSAWISSEESKAQRKLAPGKPQKEQSILPILSSLASFHPFCDGEDSQVQEDAGDAGDAGNGSRAGIGKRYARPILESLSRVFLRGPAPLLSTQAKMILGAMSHKHVTLSKFTYANGSLAACLMDLAKQIIVDIKAQIPRELALTSIRAMAREQFKDVARRDVINIEFKQIPLRFSLPPDEEDEMERWSKALRDHTLYYSRVSSEDSGAGGPLGPNRDRGAGLVRHIRHVSDSISPKPSPAHHRRTSSLSRSMSEETRDSHPFLALLGGREKDDSASRKQQSTTARTPECGTLFLTQPVSDQLMAQDLSVIFLS